MDARLIRVVAACGGFFLITLDASVVNVALPAMATTLRVGLAELQWVVDAYTVSLAGMIVLAGVVADRLGAGRVFRWGAAGFAAKEWIREEWWIRQLRTGDAREKEEAGPCRNSGRLAQRGFKDSFPLGDEHEVIAIEDTPLVPGERMGERMFGIVRVYLVGIGLRVPNGR